MSLYIRHLELSEANRFVIENHRHHSEAKRHRFSIGCYDGERLCGVAIVGNPIARKLCDGDTLEVVRLCTDGTKNACSILYARAARIAKELGYKKIITYILESESGISLIASGWFCEAENVGSDKGWNVPSRHREITVMTLFGEVQKYPLQKKKRFAKFL